MTMKKILKEWRVFSEALTLDKGLPNYGQPDGLLRKYVSALENDAFHSAKGAHRAEFEKVVGAKTLKAIDDKIKALEAKYQKDIKPLKRAIKNYQVELRSGNIEPEFETQAYSELKSAKQAVKNHEREYDSAILAKDGLGFYLANFLSAVEGDKSGQIFKDLTNLKVKIFLDSLNPEETAWLKDNFYDFIEETLAGAITNVASVWTGDVTARGKATPKKGRKTVIGGQVGDWFFGNPSPWPQGAYVLFVDELKDQLNPNERKEKEQVVEPEKKEKEEPSERAQALNDFFAKFYGDK